MADPTAATDEAWTRHRVSATGICEGCDQQWPCDIAKAWRHGYSWAKVELSIGELRERLRAAPDSARCTIAGCALDALRRALYA